MRNPILVQAWNPGRALPIEFSSYRVMRSITGRLIFRDKSAGTCMIGLPEILLPKPPPQYSAINTTSSTSKSSCLASATRVRSVLCVEPWMYTFPFCQYAIQLRGSIGWCVND